MHSRYMRFLLLDHCNSGCNNAPQCYVTRKLPVVFLSVPLFPLQNYLIECDKLWCQRLYVNCVMLILFQNCFNFTYSSSTTLSDTYFRRSSLYTLLAVEHKARYEDRTATLLKIHVLYNFRSYQLPFVNIMESYCLYLMARLP